MRYIFLELQLLDEIKKKIYKKGKKCRDSLKLNVKILNLN